VEVYTNYYFIITNSSHHTQSSSWQGPPDVSYKETRTTWSDTNNTNSSLWSELRKCCQQLDSRRRTVANVMEYLAMTTSKVSPPTAWYYTSSNTLLAPNSKSGRKFNRTNQERVKLLGNRRRHIGYHLMVNMQRVSSLLLDILRTSMAVDQLLLTKAIL